MAVRNIEKINESLKERDNMINDKIAEIRFKFNLQYEKIKKLSSDIVDAIDTYNYCCEHGMKDKLGVGNIYKQIGIQNGMVAYRHNDWKQDGGGPYDWYVRTNGDKVFIYDCDKCSEVTKMIENVRYNGEVFIAPIFERNGERTWYTCHSYEKPLNALTSFANKLEIFLKTFFNKVDNISSTL